LIDEGAGMAELVDDVAPDADIAFHTKNDTGCSKTVFLAVNHWTGNRGNIPQGSQPPLEFRLVFSETGSPSYQYTPSDSPMIGHEQAEAGASVGAVPWWEAPSFDPGNQGPTGNIDPESFTSLGGSLTRFFNADGTLNESSVSQPAIAAVDANNTTFFGSDSSKVPSIDGEPDSFPNCSGTSAAVPNAAAVTALLQDYAAGVAPGDMHRRACVDGDRMIVLWPRSGGPWISWHGGVGHGRCDKVEWMSRCR